jgi:hypothetical protein
MRKVHTKNGTSDSNTKKTRYCYQKYHLFYMKKTGIRITLNEKKKLFCSVLPHQVGVTRFYGIHF